MTTSFGMPIAAMLISASLLPLGLGALRYRRWFSLRRLADEPPSQPIATGWLASAWADGLAAALHAFALVIAFRRLPSIDSAVIESGLSSIRAAVTARWEALRTLANLVCGSLSIGVVGNALAWVGRRRLETWQRIAVLPRDESKAASVSRDASSPRLALVSAAVLVVIAGLALFGYATKRYLTPDHSGTAVGPELLGHWMQARPLLDVSAVTLAMTIVVGAGLAVLSDWSSRSRVIGLCKETSGRARTAVFSTVCLLGTATLVGRTRPLAAENADPIPIGADFGDPSAAPPGGAVHAAHRSQTEALEAAPTVTVGPSRSERSTLETIRMHVAAELPVEDLRDMLLAARQAGHTTIAIATARAQRLNRPVLGTITARRSTVVRATLGLTRHACRQQHTDPVRLPLGHGSQAGELLDRLISLQSAGRSPCVVTGGDPCPGSQKANTGCRARGSGRWDIVAETDPSAPVDALRVQHGNSTFDAVVTAPQSIRIAYLDKQGRRLGTIEALREHLEGQGEHLLMAMNAGMFTPTYAPAGLLITQGRRLNGLNLADGGGNFHLKPNGVFVVGAERAGVFDSVEPFPQRGLVGATQSGPLLLREGREHPAFRPDSTSRYIRNAVGLQDGQAVVFVISNVPVTFHELSQAFTALGCADALYLDGGISRMYLPALDRNEMGGALGPMIAVTQPR